MTTEQILALAPDASSASAGKGLANARKWSNLGASEAALWGECQGSGSKPYQTQIAIDGPTFKCSCPSRKFPCKHGLALYLLYAAQKELFASSDPPGCVAKWLEDRAGRAEKTAQKAETRAQKEADPKQVEKRTLAREKKVESGLRELELWLCDLVRSGLADAPSKSYAFWDAMSARLVDAQCPTLARRVRDLASVVASPDWQEELLARLGKLHLVVEGWKRRDELPEPLRAELRTQIGWALKEEEVDAVGCDGQPAQESEWWVLGQRASEEENLRVVRSWLWNAESGERALHLQFFHASQPVAPLLVPSTRVRALACFYPGAFPLRAALRDIGAPEPIEVFNPKHATTIETASRDYSAALACNPWLDEFPILLGQVRLRRDSERERWFVHDENGVEWPIGARWDGSWNLLARSGGAPMTVCGEWNGRFFLPLAAF